MKHVTNTQVHRYGDGLPAAEMGGDWFCSLDGWELKAKQELEPGSHS